MAKNENDSKKKNNNEKINAFNRGKIFGTWQMKMLLTAWITYASFYLLRVNYSVALPLIQEEFGFSKTEVGIVASSLLAAYAIGQFINGQLGDKFKARRMIAVGLITSAFLNILFGFSGTFFVGVTFIWVIAIIWGLNGYFQSMGWAPTVKTIANWFSKKERGKISGFVGTSYILGGAISVILAGAVADMTNDWKWIFWVPALICLLIALHWYLRARNAPEEVGLPTIEEVAECDIDCEDIRDDHHVGFKECLKIVLKSKYIWYAAFALFCLNIVRYGFMTWGVDIFHEQSGDIAYSAYKLAAFPIAGAVGAVFAGWFSDRYLEHRRAPIAAVMLFLLAFCCILFAITQDAHWAIGLVILLMIGFFTFGPHVLIVGAIPMDFGSRKAASSATGFIDGFGYIGAAITGVGSGFLFDNYGWNGAFTFWIIGAAIAGILMLIMWNAVPKVKKYH
jgi:sugar phosphate permease